MRFPLSVGIWMASVAIAVAADQPPVIGRVVDAAGQSVADVDVAFFWRANGAGVDADGKLLRFPHTPEQSKEYWGHIGEMAPGSEVVDGETPRTDADGRFSIANSKNGAFTLMAIDQGRKRGGLGIVPKDYHGAELEIRLGPLVRVRGKFVSPNSDRKLGWSYADLFVPHDPARPLGFTRLTGCGSFDGQFALALPVGRYELHANNDDQDWELRLSPHRELVLAADQLDVDLGEIPLKETQSVRFKERQARKQGTLGDYTKHYGKAPPPWHAVDARGVSKDVELAALQGKWVLLDFWGLSCGVCLKKTMPELIQFYEAHAEDRDRFEILSICIDTEGEIDSIAELDRRLEPIIKNAWGGKSIPFPILLDNTFETWRSFGIPGLGLVLLVDPAGNLVEGNLETLAEKLLMEDAANP
jgi:thiol-disulfide isomerase/thioredoxin